MPTNIVDSDAFTDPVVAPADGDAVEGPAPATMGQGLANRTAYLNNRLSRSYARITAGATSRTSGDPAFLAVDTEATAGWSIDSGTNLKFPDTGFYFISAAVSMTVSSGVAESASELLIGFNGATKDFVRTSRPGTDNTKEVAMSLAILVEITDTATDYVTLSGSGPGGTYDMFFGSGLTVLKMNGV